MSESDYLSLHILTKIYPLLDFSSSSQPIQNLIFQHFSAQNSPEPLQEKLIHYTILNKRKEKNEEKDEEKKIKINEEEKNREEEERRLVREEKKAAKDRIRKMNIFRFITENCLGGEMARVLASLIEHNEKPEVSFELSKTKDKKAQIIRFNDMYPEKTFKCKFQSIFFFFISPQFFSSSIV